MDMAKIRCIHLYILKDSSLKPGMQGVGGKDRKDPGDDWLARLAYPNWESLGHLRDPASKSKNQKDKCQMTSQVEAENS